MADLLLPRKLLGVSLIIVHPDYNVHPAYEYPVNDIALLLLDEEVDLTTYTPACLARTGESFEGHLASVYGKRCTGSVG